MVANVSKAVPDSLYCFYAFNFFFCFQPCIMFILEYCKMFHNYEYLVLSSVIYFEFSADFMGCLAMLLN